MPNEHEVARKLARTFDSVARLAAPSRATLSNAAYVKRCI
jgi:hypothetical protein